MLSLPFTFQNIGTLNIQTVSTWLIFASLRTEIEITSWLSSCSGLFPKKIKTQIVKVRLWFKNNLISIVSKGSLLWVCKLAQQIYGNLSWVAWNALFWTSTETYYYQNLSNPVVLRLLSTIRLLYSIRDVRLTLRSQLLGKNRKSLGGSMLFLFFQKTQQMHRSTCSFKSLLKKA